MHETKIGVLQKTKKMNEKLSQVAQTKCIRDLDKKEYGLVGVRKRNPTEKFAVEKSAPKIPI